MQTTRRGEHPWDVEFFRDADKRVSSTVTRAPKWSFAHSARISCFSQARPSAVLPTSLQRRLPIAYEMTYIVMDIAIVLAGHG